MKQIVNYINEKLHITSKQQYTCQPKTKKGLQKIIIQRIHEDGPECDLNDIDVSNITDMSYLFDTVKNKIFNDFNGDVSKWNVSNVKCMKFMFTSCKKFNCDLSRWDVSNATDTHYMFFECKEFNCDLSKWDVSNVTNMSYMFNYCENFNCDLSDWNVSNVKDMTFMFRECPTKPKWYNIDVWK